VSKPDLVSRSPDGKDFEVLGFDGFGAVREGGSWRSPRKGDFMDRDWFAVTDEAEVSKVSKEARAALPEDFERRKAAHQAT
jgi:hypothetical protein